MLNVFPASPSIPANKGYSLPKDMFESSSAKAKQIRREDKRKPLFFGGQTFTGVESQVILEDIKKTTFNKLLATVVQYIEEHAPNELFQQALPYLRALNAKTTAYESLDFPPLSVSFPDDGELLIEWNFEHFKIGLSFETNPEESGWYIVHDGTVRKMTGWAYMNSQTESELINTILSQVMENAA